MRWPLVFPFVLASACADKGGQTDPRAVANGLAGAMDRGDVELGMRLMAPEDKLHAAFDCGPADRLARTTERAREELRLAYEELRASGVRVRIGSFDTAQSESLQLAPGDTWRDCVARTAVEVYRGRLTLVYRKGARDDEDDERWDFVRFAPGEPWWYVPR